MNNDNWGDRARIGMFIVSSEAVPEAEWQAMVPKGVSVHAARVTAAAPWAEWRAERNGVDLADDLARGCQQVRGNGARGRRYRPTHPAASLAVEAGMKAVIAEMPTTLGDTVHVTTNGADTIAGLMAVGARRPFIVAPPWFGDAAIQSARTYYGDYGFEPAGAMRYDPRRQVAGYSASGPICPRHGLRPAHQTALPSKS